MSGQSRRGDGVIRWMGILLVIIGSAFNLVMAVLYNLISDVVGGIEISVLEEDRPQSPVV